MVVEGIVSGTRSPPPCSGEAWSHLHQPSVSLSLWSFSGHPAQSHHEPYLLSPLLRKEPETTATASRGLRSIQGLGCSRGKRIGPQGECAVGLT